MANWGELNKSAGGASTPTQSVGWSSLNNSAIQYENQKRIKEEQDRINAQNKAIEDFNKRREEIANGGIFSNVSDVIKTLFKGSDTLPDISGSSPEYQQIRQETIKASQENKLVPVIKRKISEFDSKAEEYKKSLMDSGMSESEANRKMELEAVKGTFKSIGELASGTAKFAIGLTPFDGFSSVRRIVKAVGNDKVDQIVDRNTPEYLKYVDAKLDENGILNYHPKYANIADKTGGAIADIGSWFIPLSRIGKTEKMVSAVEKIPLMSKILGVTPKIVKSGGKIFFEASLDAVDVATLDALRGKSAEDIESDAKAAFVGGTVLRGGIGSVSSLLKVGRAGKISKTIEESIGTLTDEEKAIVESMVGKGTPTDDIIVGIVTKRSQEGTSIADKVVSSVKKEAPAMDITNEERISREIASTNDQNIITVKLKGLVPESDIPTVSNAMKNMDNPDDIQKMLDGFNPEKIKDELALRIATTDSDRKIASMLKGMIPDEEISSVSRAMKGMDDDTVIRKMLDDMKVDVFKTKKVVTGQAKSNSSVPVAKKEVVVKDVSIGEAQSVAPVKPKAVSNISPTPKKPVVSSAVTHGVSKETPKVSPKPKEGVKTVKSKFSSGILKRSVKRGIISDLEAAKVDIPEFEKMNLDDQAERAMRVLEDDKKTWDIIEGRANPEDQKLRPGSVYVAKYNEAKATGDVDTMMRLANSEGAAGVANEFGTGLKAFDTRDVFDPLKVMKEIKKHKNAIIEKSKVDIKKSVKNTVDEMKDIVEKNVSSDADLSKLVTDNICK